MTLRISAAMTASVSQCRRFEAACRPRVLEDAAAPRSRLAEQLQPAEEEVAAERDQRMRRRL